jgi:fucose 4-O-acetylase-like acetyltransferase
MTEPTRERDAHLDNAKFVLIVFVTIGHTIGYTIADAVPVAGAMYFWVYLFHVPAFVFLAGYFSRWTALTPMRARGLVERVIVPYLVFSALYYVWYRLWTDKQVELDVTTPVDHMWFLLSLLAWRLLTPLLLALRHPFAVSVLVSLGAGLLRDVDLFLSLSRTLGYLPFYVLGLVVTRQSIERLRTTAARVGGIVALAVAFAVCLEVNDRTRHYPSWVYWTRGYEHMKQPALEGAGLRLGLIVVGIALGAAVIALTPTRRSWLTTLGAASLYGYLLHVAVIRIYWASPLYDASDTVVELVLVLIGCAVTAAVCSAPPVRRIFRPIVEPRLDWMFGPTSTPGGQSDSPDTSPQSSRTGSASRWTSHRG